MKYWSGMQRSLVRGQAIALVACVIFSSHGGAQEMTVSQSGLTVVTSGTASSQPRGLLSKGQLARLVKMFPGADANSDGILTPEEASKWALANQPESDMNSDDYVSIDELVAYFMMNRQSGKKAKAGKAGPKTIRKSIEAIPDEAMKTGAASLRNLYSPVVVSGQSAQGLHGASPARIAAFRYDGEWRPIPFQIDERAVVTYDRIYNIAHPRVMSEAKCLAYCDPNTFTGPDPDPTLDDDDEIVFMFRDCGAKRPPKSRPASAVTEGGIELAVLDPLTSETVFAYLFIANDQSSPVKSTPYLEYRFNLLEGPYLKAWASFAKEQVPMRPREGKYRNPEDSTVSTPYYSRHFSGKAICDGLTIKPPYGNGVNIYDMRKHMFKPGDAQRTPLTFTQGEGAFICNISGPVRAIRSCVGANSGPRTQFNSVFYDRREEYSVNLRVHPIGGTGSLEEYNREAIGMRYRNSANPDGVIIDGKPDALKPGPAYWEMVEGKQGNVCVIPYNECSFVLRPDFYYLDDLKPKTPQVCGDDVALGASGVFFTGPIPNTDPGAKGECDFWTGGKVYFFGLDQPTPETARRLLLEEAHPVSITVTPL